MHVSTDAKLSTPSVDITAQLKSRIEWWFVHGRYTSRSLDDRYFMVSVFRGEVPDRAGIPTSGYSALVSCLDSRDGTQSASSRVDRTILDVINRPPALREIDPFSHDVVLDEIRRYGLPREFSCPGESPSLSTMPLDFEWADLRLAS